MTNLPLARELEPAAKLSFDQVDLRVDSIVEHHRVMRDAWAATGGRLGKGRLVDPVGRTADVTQG